MSFPPVPSRDGRAGGWTVEGMDEIVTGPLASPLERVRAARAQLDDAKLQFDCAVSEARLAGASLREVADVAGLSHTGVAKLCRRVVASASSLGLTLVEGRWWRRRADRRQRFDRPGSS